MIYRALTNMLVLSWPETNDARQEWAWRTAELTRVIAGATKVLTGLQQSAQWNQDSWLLQQGVCISPYTVCRVMFLFSPYQPRSQFVAV